MPVLWPQPYLAYYLENSITYILIYVATVCDNFERSYLQQKNFDPLTSSIASTDTICPLIMLNYSVKFRKVFIR